MSEFRDRLDVALADRYRIERELVVFVHPDGRLLVAEFDAGRLELAGTPATVQEGVFDGQYRSGGAGWVNLGVSVTGVVAYLGGQHLLSELVMVDRDGGRAVPLNWAGSARYGFPRFVPDGSQLVVEKAHPSSSNAGDIWRLDLIGRRQAQLTTDSASVYPEVTAGGERVVYANSDGAEWDLAWMPLQGGAPRSLLSRASRQWHGLITPTGNTLLFMAFVENTSNDLWMIPVDGSSPAEPLEVSPRRDRAPALSPDGKWVAYGSDKSGRDEVYVRNLGNPDIHDIVSSGGHSPRWGADGREIFYVGLDVDSLFSVSVFQGSGTRLEFGPPRALLAVPYVHNEYQANYDVHPDGRRFVFVNDRAGAADEIEVIMNWFGQVGAGRRR